MLGATGAIYALRRSLWRPLPPGTILDDVLAPMRAVLAGHRVVFEPAARAFDYTVARRRRREPAEGPDACRQRADPVVRAAPGRPDSQPRVAAVRLAQDRPPARALRPHGALRLEHRALGDVDVLRARAVRRRRRSISTAGTAPGSNTGWRWRRRNRSLVQRTGAMAFTIVVMNVSAVAGAGSALLGRKVWR